MPRLQFPRKSSCYSVRPCVHRGRLVAGGHPHQPPRGSPTPSPPPPGAPARDQAVNRPERTPGWGLQCSDDHILGPKHATSPPPKVGFQSLSWSSHVKTREATWRLVLLSLQPHKRRAHGPGPQDRPSSPVRPGLAVAGPGLAVVGRSCARSKRLPNQSGSCPDALADTVPRAAVHAGASLSQRTVPPRRESVVLGQEHVSFALGGVWVKCCVPTWCRVPLAAIH